MKYFQLLAVAVLADFYECALNNLSAANDIGKPQWILIHYHKSGHDLVQRITDFFRNDVKASIYGNYSATARQNISEQMIHFSQDIIILHSPNIPFHWIDFHSRRNNVKIVHFVREPYDMVMSGYLYHSQSPSPEKWERNMEYHPCSANATMDELSSYQRYIISELTTINGEF